MASGSAADLKAKLAEALELAKECEDDCAVEWDTVEELSAAASKEDAPKANNNATLPKGAEAYIKETRALIDEAQSAATFDMDTIRAIENAAATASSAKRSAGSADTSKLKRIEDALAEAIAVAQSCTEDCAAEWDTVEELSAAKKHASD